MMYVARVELNEMDRLLVLQYFAHLLHCIADSYTEDEKSPQNTNLILHEK